MQTADRYATLVLLEAESTLVGGMRKAQRSVAVTADRAQRQQPDTHTDSETLVANSAERSGLQTAGRRTYTHTERRADTQTDRDACLNCALKAQGSDHFISEALKGVHSEAWNPVLAQQDASAELLCSFCHVGVCKAPGWSKGPTLHPTQSTPHWS